MKWDGHTHSQFCRHGSGEETALMVEAAIRLRFERYSIVEHAPLPDGIIEDRELRLDFGLMSYELDDYFSHLADLKRIYGDRIQILAGLEIDFFEGLESFAVEMVHEYADRLDDVIFSIHFLQGGDGFVPLDYKPEVFEKDLLGFYGSIDAIQIAYWTAVERMVAFNLPLPPTKRLGHLGLINKFAGLFEKRSKRFDSVPFFETLLQKIKKNGWALDFNVAGLNQKWYQDVYLTEAMLYWVSRLGISTVYGSDAHGVETVGQYYDVYLDYHRS